MERRHIAKTETLVKGDPAIKRDSPRILHVRVRGVIENPAMLSVGPGEAYITVVNTSHTNGGSNQAKLMVMAKMNDFFTVEVCTLVCFFSCGVARL